MGNNQSKLFLIDLDKLKKSAKNLYDLCEFLKLMWLSESDYQIDDLAATNDDKKPPATKVMTNYK